MPRKMLVADKSIVIQKSIGITFAQEDFDVSYVNDGEEALQKAQEIKPDLLLMHIGIPKKSGYEVCEELKKDPAMSKTPVLLMVGTHEPLDEAKCNAVGADGYMIKPFESQGLIDRVNELIQKAESQTAAPPPPPAAPVSTPSPASTIAGQMPPTTPSPNSTIAGQMPNQSRDTPMLDLDVPAAPAEESPAPAADFDSAFDFSFDEEAGAEATAVTSFPSEPPAPTENTEAALTELDVDPGSPATPAAPETPEPVATPAASGPSIDMSSLDSGGDGEFWDLAAEEPTNVSQPPEAPEPVDSPIVEPEPTAQVAQEPAAPAADVPQVTTEESPDFAFDFSPDSEGMDLSEPSPADTGAGFDFSAQDMDAEKPAAQPEPVAEAIPQEPQIEAPASPVAAPSGGQISL